MLALQNLHLPLRSIKLIMGILSYHLIVLKQAGQNENPLKGDRHSRGNLKIQTLAKLPMDSPMITRIISVKKSTVLYSVFYNFYIFHFFNNTITLLEEEKCKVGNY